MVVGASRGLGILGMTVAVGFRHRPARVLRVCHASCSSFISAECTESGLSCIFGLCFGGVRKCSRNGGVSAADVPLSRVIDNRAAVSGKCHSKRQTARTTAILSNMITAIRN